MSIAPCSAEKTPPPKTTTTKGSCQVTSVIQCPKYPALDDDDGGLPVGEEAGGGTGGRVGAAAGKAAESDFEVITVNCRLHVHKLAWCIASMSHENVTKHFTVEVMWNPS